MSEDFYQSRAWLDLRYRVLRASGGACQCCGHRGSPDNPLQVDHIKPRSKFPKLELVQSNLQVLCRACNMGKGARDSTDWRTSPSQELSILAALEPAKRFRLQQLGWLKAHGETAQVRSEAQREYRKLWRQIEADWIATKEAAQ